MNLTELRDAVRSVLEDPGGFRFTDIVVDRYAKDALRYVARQLGRTQGRTAISMVQGQQEYDLPLGIKKLVSVRVLPENLSIPVDPSVQKEPPEMQQVELDQIPVTYPQERDPTHFAVNAAGGPNGQNLSIFVWPPPRRTEPDSIVITYDMSFDLDTEIPFIDEYELVIIRYAAAGCLTELEDSTSVQRGEYLKDLAMRDLADTIDVSALNARDDVCRAFP